MASFDSSDTWASCQPFPSATDLSTGGLWSPSQPTNKSVVVVNNTDEEDEEPSSYNKLIRHQQVQQQPDDYSPVRFSKVN